MSHNPAFDSSIPVLTEVVLEPVAPVGQAEAEAAIAVAEELAEAEVAPEAPAAPEAALQALPESDWDELEARIAERVVAQLQPQIDAVVRNALASAADQIHIGLRQAVEQVVAQQVAAIQFGQK
jgi:type VI protein secretion system component VasK